MSVHLADGSVSKKPCKNVWLSVKSHQLARPQRLNFIIMSGSKNLLDRWAMYKLWPQQYSTFKDAISASQQSGSVVVSERISDDRQLATPVVAVAAGSMTSSRSDSTYQRPGWSKSASPAHHGDVAGSVKEENAIVAVMKEMCKQLCSLKQVVLELHGHVHGGEGVQQARGTTEDSQYGEGCEQQQPQGVLNYALQIAGGRYCVSYMLYQRARGSNSELLYLLVIFFVIYFIGVLYIMC